MISASVPQADVYTDLHGLAELKFAASENSPEALKAAAQQFEAIFIQMMLKSMRDASMGDPLFGSSQGDTYRDIFDQQLSINLSKNGHLGLADIVVRQLSQDHPGQEGDALDDKIPATSTPILINNINPYELNSTRQFILRGNSTDTPISSLSSYPYKTLPDSQPVSRAHVPGNSISESVKNNGSALDPARTSTPDRINTQVNEAARFSTPVEFVTAIAPHARKVANELDVAPEALIAQAALETGWGKFISRHADGSSSNNLFGIKADGRWKGDRLNVTTLEFSGGAMHKVRAPFRSYSSIEESFRDYAEFLKSEPRYTSALQTKGNPVDFARALQNAGYATDPDYAKKITRLLGNEVITRAVDTRVTASIETIY